MKSILYSLSVIIALFTGVKEGTAQCPTDYLTVSANMNGNILVYSIQNTGQAAMPIDLSVNFGDGQTFNQLFTSAYTGTHVYPLVGGPVYMLCIYTTDANSCGDTLCIPVAAEPCVSNPVQLSAIDSVSGNSVFIYPQVSGGVAPYTFQINGTGGFSGSDPIVIDYPLSGQYSYTLVVTDAAGCSQSFTDSVVVGCAGQLVVFTPAPIAPQVYQFIPAGMPGIVSYLWTFTDGMIDTSPMPVHTFPPVGGFYDVCLQATFEDGCTSNFCMVVQVQDNCQSNPVLVTATATVTGTSASIFPSVTGGCGNYTYTWSHPGGTQTTGDPYTIQYPADGTYAVVLTVADACGCAAVYTIPVTIGCGGSAGTATPVNMGNGAVTNCYVNFFDHAGPNGSYGNNENYTQTFFPATPGAALSIDFSSFDLEQDFDFLTIYNGSTTNGNVIAQLTGDLQTPFSYTSSSSDGALTFQFTSDFMVNGNGWSGIITCNLVNFSSESAGGGQMIFTPISSEAIVSWSWNYGDGSTGTSLSHTYASPGTYVVCLSGENADGCVYNSCHYVVVPCGFEAEMEIQVNGADVTVILPDMNPAYYYSLASEQLWTQLQNDTTVVTLLSPGTYQFCVLADGPCFDSTCTNVTISDENSSVLSGTTWDDANGNGIMDNGEETLPGVFVTLCAVTSGSDSTLCQTAYSDENGFYSFAVFPGDYVISANPSQWLYGQTLPSAPNYMVTAVGDVDQTNLNFGFQNQAATIEGTVFVDGNENGIQDNGEQGYQWIYVLVGNNWVMTDANGHYSIVVIPGTYNVHINQLPTGHTITVPAGPSFSYTVAATSTGTTYSGNNFGIWADPDFNDLSATISQISTVTPGFPVMTHLGYCNNGFLAQSGTFTYYWDPLLNITSASVFSPAPSNFSAASHTATWNFSNLAGGACGYIYMNAVAPTNLVIGTPVVNTVIVTPMGDSNPANNIDTLHQNVTGSWDPNDKHVAPAGLGENGAIMPNTPLSYTIRFQNTGSAPAVTVVLVDTISTDLSLETFQMIGASHPYTVDVDNATRVIRWTFSGIMLPDSLSEPTASIGFINFRISPLADQPDGTVLNNFADIYFDFNEPVRTNTTVNTIDRALAIGEIKSYVFVQVFPNPFSGTTQFLVNTPDNSNALIEIYNATGQKIVTMAAQSGKAQNFDASEYSAGIYMYNVIYKGKSLSGKLIVQ